MFSEFAGHLFWEPDVNIRYGIAAKMAILAFVLVAVAAASVGTFSYFSFRQEMINQNIRLQGEEINIEAEVKRNELEELLSDSRFLAKTPPIQGIQRAAQNEGVDPHDQSSLKEWVSRLEQIFESYLRVKEEYIQIDLVQFDERWRPLVHVKKVDGAAFRIEKRNIREAWIPSFSQTNALMSGELVLSRIELVRDDRKIIEPHVPVIRAATPVFDSEGQFYGAVIVNMDLRPVFQQISRGEAPGYHMHFITNEKGDYIYHPNPAKRFGFEFGQEFRIQDDYPELQQLLASGQAIGSGQIVVDHDGYQLIIAYKKLRLDMMEEDAFILMLEAKPYSIATAGIAAIRAKSSLLILILIVVGGLIAMALARRQIKPLETFKEGIVSFSEGKQDISLPATRDDEIGVLARAFQDMMQQVDERKKEILRSEERFRQFAEHINDVFWITSADGTKIEYASPAFEQIWGRSCEDLYQNPMLWFESVHPDDQKDIVGPDLVSRTLDKSNEEFRIVGVDGKVKWIENRAFVVRDKYKNAMRIVGVAKDISAQKADEQLLNEQNQALKAINEQLTEAQNQLLQSEKMASVGQLAAGVAHEINNPAGYVNSNLGSLKTYVGEMQGLLDKYEACEAVLPESEAKAISQIKEEIEYQYLKDDVPDLINESLEGISRLKNIVQDLKDFSRVDEAEWQWADLHKGIDSTLNIANNEIKYKADVIKEYGDIPEVNCIASQVNQVVMNIVVNAAHAIEERGTITIRTGTKPNGWVWLAISDTGKGIAPEHLRKIFDPFFTTKPVGQGTGLGMSLCYSIIEKHGGSIEVESEVGKGTTFTVNLPMQQRKPVQDD